jgi:hypothetical protein
MGYGKESYERLADEGAKRQVGMSFCLNVLEMDPGAFMVCSCPGNILVLKLTDGNTGSL